MQHFEFLSEFLTSERFTVYRNVLAVLGAAYVFKKLFNTVWSAVGGINAYYLAPWGITRINLRKYGSWASEFTNSPQIQ